MIAELIFALWLSSGTLLPLSLTKSAWYLVSSGVLLYFTAIYSLSWVATEQHETSSDAKHRNDRTVSILVNSTRAQGLVAAAWILTLPYRVSPEDPPLAAFVRVVSFFCALKLLDLTLARGHKPPRRIEGGKEVPTTTWQSRAEYIWLLATQCRYHSFDIAVVERGRTDATSKAWTYGPVLFIPLLWFLFRLAVLKVLLGLLAIQLGLELVHTILHRSCSHPLFWQPFAAETIADFWKTHWHQGAAPFLYSCGYLPARTACSKAFGKKVGSAAGVLATFSLSGIWHAWAAAALVTEPWRIAMGMWLLFMGHGVACLMERALLGGGKGGVVYRTVCWGVALLAAGAWLEDAERTTKVPWLAA